MDYTIFEREPFSVVGIRRITPNAAGTWAIVSSDDNIKKMNDLYGKFFDLGLCFGFGEDGSNDYMCAIEWAGETPDEFERFDYPAMTWLKFEANGTISSNILGDIWQKINNEFLPHSKYKKANATIEKFVVWDVVADRCNVEVWIPVSLK